MFMHIQLFLFLHDNTKIHAHIIDSYFYHHHYFTVCGLQVTSFIFSSIQSTIARNSKISAFFSWA